MVQNKKIHMAVHLEYYCRKCKKVVSARVHEYEPVSCFEELDKQLDSTNQPIIPFACPQCGTEQYPEDIVMYDITDGKMTRVLVDKIGSSKIPVVNGEETPYGNVMSKEEQAEYERGLAKIKDHFKEHEKEFWQNYCTFAVEKWQVVLKEINEKEYLEAYRTLGVPLQPSTANLHAWRRDAEKRFQSKTEKEIFWRAANQYIIHHEFLWTPTDSWPMDDFIRLYGRERVTYLTLHIPLPEELEKYRTIKLSQIIKKRTGETGVLFERIGQLGRELEKHKKRAGQLGQTVLELRKEINKLQEELAQTKRELARKPVVVDRQAEDARKIKEFKGLIRELREEIERLRNKLPQEEKEHSFEEDQMENKQQETAQPETDLSVLAGKTVLIVGWPNEETKGENCKIFWHDGDKVDIKLQALLKEADILVFLTRFGSHAAMWWLKEQAIEENKPIYFVKSRNVQRILQDIAEKQKTQ
ncbi:DUF2325 domain-containing protein [Thermanaerosceptrum fracticalcis]|uniref:DUF2325 domain-containing protein n=1 Tax=Thermanaerosceptrum fracticalcis TaxID=1712410 RepID=A0A7G6E042_THEFR|nr:DUF2325 domain-containing protein [Thermanaerosceptrum fracticalcis]QNB45446.1 DUF2325 domain-containing protein [Thermanaerosceptrum fracticalcis]